MKLPIIDAKTMIKILVLKGYRKIRQTGSHVQFKNDREIYVTVPLHPTKDLGRGLIRKIMRDMEIDRDEFIRLIREV